MQITALIYGFNMLLIFNSGWAIWTYVTGKRRLVDEGLDAALVRGGSLMGLVYTIIMLSAIGISFVNPVISFFIYGFIVVAFIIRPHFIIQTIIYTAKGGLDKSSPYNI
jgi:hypothetical protein